MCFFCDIYARFSNCANFLVLLAFQASSQPILAKIGPNCQWSYQRSSNATKSHKIWQHGCAHCLTSNRRSANNCVFATVSATFHQKILFSFAPFIEACAASICATSGQCRSNDVEKGSFPLKVGDQVREGQDAAFKIKFCLKRKISPRNLWPHIAVYPQKNISSRNVKTVIGFWSGDDEMSKIPKDCMNIYTLI